MVSPVLASKSRGEWSHLFLTLFAGVKSRVRAILLGEEHKATSPTYTGRYAYRGLIPMEKVVNLLGEDLAKNSTLYLGYNGHVLTLPIVKGTVMNVVAFQTKPGSTWEDPHWVLPVERKTMEEDFKDWGHSVKSVLSLMEKSDVWALFDDPPAHLPPRETVHHGRRRAREHAAPGRRSRHGPRGRLRPIKPARLPAAELPDRIGLPRIRQGEKAADAETRYHEQDVRGTVRVSGRGRC